MKITVFLNFLQIIILQNFLKINFNKSFENNFHTPLFLIPQERCEK